MAAVCLQEKQLISQMLLKYTCVGHVVIGKWRDFE